MSLGCYQDVPVLIDVSFCGQRVTVVILCHLGLLLHLTNCICDMMIGG